MVESRKGEVARLVETRRSTGLAQGQAEGVHGGRPVVMVLILELVWQVWRKISLFEFVTALDQSNALTRLNDRDCSIRAHLPSSMSIEYHACGSAWRS